MTGFPSRRRAFTWLGVTLLLSFNGHCGSTCRVEENVVFELAGDEGAPDHLAAGFAARRAQDSALAQAEDAHTCAELGQTLDRCDCLVTPRPHRTLDAE